MATLLHRSATGNDIIHEQCDIIKPFLLLYPLRKKNNLHFILIIIFFSCILLYVKESSTIFSAHLIRRSLYLTQEVIVTEQTLENCHQKEKRNFVFVRTHKTGSDTLSTIFRRFGYVRNLSFVLPLNNYSSWAVGWPNQLYPNVYRPSKTGEYNIICEHAVFNISLYKTVVPKDSVYITSVREPYSRFVSAFYFFKVNQLMKNKTNVIETFLQNPDYHDRMYINKLNRNGSFPSLVRNNMAFDLGFQAGFPIGSEDWTYNDTAIDEWLKELDKKMDLVMMTEYMDESLVLLRRLMCWSMKDILYQSRNINHSRKKDNSSTEYLMNVYRKWSEVDVKLYDHFLKKFQVRLSQQDASFWQEVAHFKDGETRSVVIL